MLKWIKKHEKNLILLNSKKIQLLLNDSFSDSIQQWIKEIESLYQNIEEINYD